MSAYVDEQSRLGERREMVRTQLAQRDVRAAEVLAALERVPRHLFVPPQLAGRAYDDAALPADCGQTISQPYMVARMTELLELSPHDRVLEVGTGTGYQTAVLAEMVPQGHVFTIEWYLRLMSAAVDRLRDLGFENITFRCGDGTLGWPEHAPYDAILVAAGGPEVPPKLIDQLASGGRLVCPIGSIDEQTLVRVGRIGERIIREDLMQCRFVKLVGAAGWRIDPG